MTSPRKSLILYNYYNNTNNDAIPHIDKVARLGCSGRIMLEDQNQGSSRLQDVIQLLGLCGCTSEIEMKQTLITRFGKMKIGLISRSTQLIEMAASAGLTFSHLVKEQAGLEEISLCIRDALEKQKVDCLLVDFSNHQQQSLSWRWMDAVMEEWLKEPELMKCVITKCNHHHQLLQQQQWMHVIPSQSYEYRNGIRIKIQEDQQYTCSYYHAETTRMDELARFNMDSSTGCNGTILAWHYLAEIGHKLGYVPKYGA